MGVDAIYQFHPGYLDSTIWWGDPERDHALATLEGGDVIVAGPDIRTRGFAEGDEVFERIRPKIEQALADARGKGITDTATITRALTSPAAT